MGKKFLEVEKQFDEEGNLTVLLQTDTELIRKGILKELTPSQLKVLMVISAHADDNGECFPSLRYIADVTGIALRTVDTAIKGLLDIRIDDKPIITRKIEGTGARKKSKYNLGTTEKVELETVVDDIPVKLTCKYYLDKFFNTFLEVYGTKYIVSGNRDATALKRMMKVYTHEQMEIIIDIVVREYSKRWSNVKFPAPTIGAMASFLCVQALEIDSKRAKVDTSWDDCENDEQSLDL